MSVVILELTARDPIVARDGRPFGFGQGNRMHGLAWPYPSVVAGSLRTAMVKADPALDFTRNTPLDLLRAEVAGVFPVSGGQLYVPAPNDAMGEPDGDGKGLRAIHRTAPMDFKEGEGCDFPSGDVQPVMLPERSEAPDFKAKAVSAWWPVRKMVDWLTSLATARGGDFLDETFLESPRSEIRDHVCLDANTGTAQEGQIFSTTGLNLTHLPRHGVQPAEPFAKRFAEIALSVRVTIPEPTFEHVARLNLWHPLGGERRLVHWRRSEVNGLWDCPAEIHDTMKDATKVRMVLASPAVFAHGCRPGWLDAETLTGRPFGDGPTLKLVGATLARWRAVSGWSLQRHKETDRPGPKKVRRFVPAGAVYFFRVEGGDPRILASNGWLKPVSDDPQDRNDGFGLSLWGIW